ncbi:MAG TPA: hypothetical protein VFH31_17890 [Pyrinomonadaceae bacterium]|nr:hypothetical protein [Pyrinomonadaceae bacterium]
MRAPTELMTVTRDYDQRVPAAAPAARHFLLPAVHYQKVTG